MLLATGKIEFMGSNVNVNDTALHSAVVILSRSHPKTTLWKFGTKEDFHDVDVGFNVVYFAGRLP